MLDIDISLSNLFKFRSRRNMNEFLKYYSLYFPLYCIVDRMFLHRSFCQILTLKLTKLLQLKQEQHIIVKIMKMKVVLSVEILI